MDAPGADERGRTQFQRVRRLAYLARSLHTKEYRLHGYGDHGVMRRVYEVSHPREFRRAFVRAMLPDPFQVKRGRAGVEMSFCGRSIAHIDRDRSLVWSDDNLSPISLAPVHVDRFASLAFRYVCKLTENYYWDALGTAGYDRDWLGLDREVNFRFTEDAGGFCYSRRRRLRTYAIRAIKEFCAELDPDALRSMRKAMLTHNPYRHAIEALTCPVLGPRWRQALDAYPAAIHWALSVDFPDGSEYQRPSVVEFVCVSIDRGLPLIAALSAALGVSATEVRRLHGLFPQRTGLIPDREAMAWLVALPQHLRPVRRDDWRAAFKLYEISQMIAGLVAHCDAPYIPNRAGREHAKRLTVGIKVPLGQDKRIAACEGLRDVIQSLHELHCYVPTCGIERLSLGRLADLNTGWHRVQREATALAAKRARAELETPWPGVLPQDTLAVGGFMAVELTTPSELIAEGIALDHCVGSYQTRCYGGLSRIVSLRDGEGRSLSTIEFGFRKGAVSIVQHLGRRNAQVSKDLRVAGKAVERVLRKSGNASWPSLPCPPSLATQIQGLINAELRAFFQAKLPSAAFPSQADLDALRQDQQDMLDDAMDEFDE